MQKIKDSSLLMVLIRPGGIIERGEASIETRSYADKGIGTRVHICVTW